MEDQALTVIRDWWGLDPGCGYASTSWGKDSVVVAHLVAQTGLPIPLVWVRVTGLDNPDCEAVRDAFLDRHPHMADRYSEIWTPTPTDSWWDDVEETASKYKADAGWRLAALEHGDRHITGVRAEESRVRALAQARWGDSSYGACRPIGRWEATDVFAYLYARDLPVHPAYAMSHGGALDRRWIRVHSIGTVEGADRGKAEWEAYYYPDVVRGGGVRDGED